MSHDTSLENERWLPVVGYEGAYEVSDHGRVKSLKRTVTFKDGRKRTWPELILKQSIRPTGHRQVTLARDGKIKPTDVHRLIMMAFVGPPPEGMEVLHHDDEKENNSLENLRYGTRGENLRDSVRNRKHGNSRKDQCPRGHNLVPENLVPSSTGRDCLACSRTRADRRKLVRGSTEFQELSDEKYVAIMRG